MEMVNWQKKNSWREQQWMIQSLELCQCIKILFNSTVTLCNYITHLVCTLATRTWRSNMDVYCIRIIFTNKSNKHMNFEFIFERKNFINTWWFSLYAVLPADWLHVKLLSDLLKIAKIQRNNYVFQIHEFWITLPSLYISYDFQIV